MSERLVVRISRGRFEPEQFDTVRGLIDASSMPLKPALQQLRGLVYYHAGVDQATSTVVNVSVWTDLDAARQMDTLAPMLAQRPILEAAGVTFDRIANYEPLWSIGPVPVAAMQFVEFSRDKLLGQYWPRLQRCVASLTDEQIWWRPNEASNSVGNLLLHLNGNVTQWLVVTFGGGQDARNRPAEFAERGTIPGRELLSRLGLTMSAAEKVLAGLTEPDLLRTYQIQGYTMTGLAAVYQVVEHFGLHYGQVSYITKLLSGEDLGFYSQLNRTGRLPADVGTARETP